MGRVFRRTYRDKQGRNRKCATYSIRYSRNGKQFEESTKTRKKADAEHLLKLREGDISRGAPVNPALYRVTFEDAMKAVVAHLSDNGMRSLDDQSTRIRLHLTPFFAGRPLATIGPDQVREYRAKRTEEGAAVATINRELAILKQGFRIMHGEGRVMTIPTIRLAREHNTRTGFFEADQVHAIAHRLPAAFRPVLMFAYYTGWRWISEVLPLTWNQVDFEAEEVRLEPGTTKNDKGRTFPFTASLRTLLVEQRDARDALKKSGRISPFVFQVDGQAIPEGTFVKAWKVARLAAGQPGRLMHDLRRTAVRNLVRAGIPESVAMKMTGHQTRAVFDRYDIVSPGDLKDAAKKLDATATIPPIMATPLQTRESTGDGEAVKIAAQAV